MLVNWKALISLGIAFWCLLCVSDIFGESTWKRCSYNFDDILRGYEEIQMEMQKKNVEVPEEPKEKTNFPTLAWNVCAFLCSLIFCSVVKSISWLIWKIFHMYNTFRNRKTLSEKLANRIQENESSETLEPANANCKLLFENRSFVNAKQDDGKMLETFSKELEELKKQKSELVQQLVNAQKENLNARQQIEEYKLESFMIKEKLTRTANSLKENLKYKDFATANHEVMAKKAYNLEVHLKDVSRDRDILRSRLSNLEKNYEKLEGKIKMYEKQGSETFLEQLPEKDTTDETVCDKFSPTTEVTDATDMDIEKFNMKMIQIQKSIGTYEPERSGFEANSKISVDLDESGLETVKENDGGLSQERMNQNNADINDIKQNLLNYNAYKTQMLRPKLKNNKAGFYSDTTGSSSDENGTPQRIISSTAEFQNFLKTLTSNSKSGLTFEKAVL